MNKSKGWSDLDCEKYDLAVVIGRFQPFHNAHDKIIKQAKSCSNNVLVLIGSSFKARDIRNPFTYDERVSMMPEDVLTAPIIDDLYNDQIWVATVQQEVDNTLCELFPGDYKDRKVCLLGHKKDESSYYLDMFPKYDFLEIGNIRSLNSTNIRDELFGNQEIPKNDIPERVKDFITDWCRDKREIYQNLCDEHLFIKAYKGMWANAPFQPVFVTTDAVTICNGHILLIKRRVAPGKGLWALPGGFLGIDERVEESMYRELEEETRIKVNRDMLKASTKGSHVFDHPNRSERGRTITHAYLIVLQSRELPKVRGSDDAERAKWVPLSEFYEMSDQLYEDHFSIASYMINRS